MKASHPVKIITRQINPRGAMVSTVESLWGAGDEKQHSFEVSWAVGSAHKQSVLNALNEARHRHLKLIPGVFARPGGGFTLSVKVVSKTNSPIWAKAAYGKINAFVRSNRDKQQ